MFLCRIEKYEQAHDKTYNKTWATSKDSDQPAHPRSLFRDFDDRMCLVQHLRYLKRDKLEPLPYRVDVEAGLSLCWSQRFYCRFYSAQAQISILFG